MAAVDDARALADEVLFPAAGEVDLSGRIPPSHFTALAGAGLYRVAADLPIDEFCAVVEALAGGCLTTAFVWIQHHGLVRGLLGDDAPAPLRDRYLPELLDGVLRSGIALAGLHPGPPKLVATRAGDDGGSWRLTGAAPWVTGWGIVDVLQVAARTDDQRAVVFGVIDADEAPGLTAAPQTLVAVNASRTVELRFDDFALPADRVIRTVPYDEETFGGGAGLRVNGSLSLGLVDRCCRIIGPSRLDGELGAARARLDTSAPDAMFAARAAASALAVRAANAVVVHDGSRAITAGATGQRLAREAMFLGVFGTRPRLREALLGDLGV